MREGMYLINYGVRPGPQNAGMNEGTGTLIFEGGTIYGADVGGARYDGEYQLNPAIGLNPATGHVEIKLKVTFPPNVVSIFGIAHQYEWAIQVTTQMDPNQDAGPLQIMSDVGPVSATYMYLRSLPAAA